MEVAALYQERASLPSETPLLLLLAIALVSLALLLVAVLVFRLALLSLGLSFLFVSISVVRESPGGLAVDLVLLVRCPASLMQFARARQSLVVHPDQLQPTFMPFAKASSDLSRWDITSQADATFPWTIRSRVAAQWMASR